MQLLNHIWLLYKLQILNCTKSRLESTKFWAYFDIGFIPGKTWKTTKHLQIPFEVQSLTGPAFKELLLFCPFSFFSYPSVVLLSFFLSWMEKRASCWNHVRIYKLLLSFLALLCWAAAVLLPGWKPVPPTSISLIRKSTGGEWNDCMECSLAAAQNRPNYAKSNQPTHWLLYLLLSKNS